MLSWFLPRRESSLLETPPSPRQVTSAGHGRFVFVGAA